MVIIAAISESDQSRDVVIQANKLAHAFDDVLHLVHVIEETEYTRIVERQSNSRETDTGTVEDNVAAQVADGLKAVVSVDHEVISRIGNPGKKIVEYADEVNARYLVVGGRARSPVGKALFGSETQSILLNANQPVVTVTADE